ncbi:MAG: FAD-dependent oxidoreductase [Treponema sp.]|jgi:NAD(P)H-nitrite reductase large subunit|nr:FAD-dependent oxidoreductase [Treponema sp.]
MKYVIIGNSAAGIGAVEGIRAAEAALQTGKQGEITVITDEPYHTYSRPLISYLLLGKVTEETMKYRGDNFYAGNNVNLLKDVTVTKIDAVKKMVFLSDNSSEPYDKLLVAAGSSPFTPPFEGLDSVKDKFTFMCLDDAKKLNEALEKNNEKASDKKRVLIIGAGLIGLKCAEGIAKRVSNITIVDLAPRILSSILDEDGAAVVREHIEKESAGQGTGIEFRLARSVKKFDENKAILDDGETVYFDILVLAVGVRPNTSLLKDIAEIDRGIIVNGRSETSAKDIYAAGDCTQTVDVSSGQNKIMALLPNAYMQGECAGMNMAGGEKSFDRAIPMNAIGFFGLHMITAGNYTGDVYSGKKDRESYKKLFYSDNKLNGYILIGNVEKAGIYTSIIRERTPLDSIDFALVCERPGLMAFTKEDRMIKLGGAKR